MTRENKVFKKNQKVWAVFTTGSLAYKCLGRNKHNGKWIKYWVHFDDGEGKSFKGGIPDAKLIGEVEVSGQFGAFLDSRGATYYDNNRKTNIIREFIYQSKIVLRKMFR